MKISMDNVKKCKNKISKNVGSTNQIEEQNYDLVPVDNSEIVEKIYNDLVKAQENFLAPVDNDYLVDDTLDNAVFAELDTAMVRGLLFQLGI